MRKEVGSWVRGKNGFAPVGYIYKPEYISVFVRFGWKSGHED
jgi:hypothetical protein